ncbi:MAG: YitT family protein, partial [Lachnospiraceae bacterium]
FTSMNTGVSETIGMSLALYQGLFNIALFAILILADRKNLHFIHIGAVFNMFLLGMLIENILKIFCRLMHIARPENLAMPFPARIATLIVGILITTLGCSLYMTADLGTAPFDALTLYTSERFPRIPYAVQRIISDTAAATVAFIFGGPLGIATIILMLFTGPLISFWNRKVSEPVVKRFGEKRSSQSFNLQHPVSDTDMSLNILR